jgi:hypothetical protein
LLVGAEGSERAGREAAHLGLCGPKGQLQGGRRVEVVDAERSGHGSVLFNESGEYLTLPYRITGSLRKLTVGVETRRTLRRKDSQRSDSHGTLSAALSDFAFFAFPFIRDLSVLRSRLICLWCFRLAALYWGAIPHRLSADI